LQEVKPLIDNTYTPRGARKQIILERNFDKDPWIYNKSTVGIFAESMRDKNKSKILKQIRRSKKRESSLNNSKFSSSHGYDTGRS
jgi:hypothetical protein